MSVATYHIVIEQGSTFQRTLRYRRTGFDFAGYTARGKIRTGFDGGDDVAEFVVGGYDTSVVGVFELQIGLPWATTAAITLPAASASLRLVDLGFHDVEIVGPGEILVARKLQGTVKLSRETTK